jgi:hypothetical protein
MACDQAQHFSHCAAGIKCVLLKQPEQKSNKKANKANLTPFLQKTVPKELDHGV